MKLALAQQQQVDNAMSIVYGLAGQIIVDAKEGKFAFAQSRAETIRRTVETLKAQLQLAALTEGVKDDREAVREG